MDIVHLPVMLGEILEMLNLKNEGIYVDATLGLGGHSEGILQRAEGCTLIGIDRDEEAIGMAAERLKAYQNVRLVKDVFSNMKKAVNGLGYEKVDGIVLDAGVSTLHLRSEDRGFSFLNDAPLDMRMDRTQAMTAEKVVNTYPEKDLADLIFRYGEERYSRRIAKAMIFSRKIKPISSCSELAAIVEKAVGRRGKIHPATRTFQALRIEVNRELDELPAALDAGAAILEKEGRFCVLSYHSLEDRIVKHAFKKLAKDGLFKIITKKPLVPGDEERMKNPSSRSAKLRVVEKI
ncbi:MAG: 16S rRNA (cytosine(1402)-N(4))-methyltransferase RsmH [Nitrospirota bacterium]|nr:16S rRNA (cytosine(1402)-N(4))-methyltransferase RsmH [Nitrospirota bacterium]